MLVLMKVVMSASGSATCVHHNTQSGAGRRAGNVSRHQVFPKSHIFASTSFTLFCDQIVSGRVSCESWSCETTISSSLQCSVN